MLNDQATLTVLTSQAQNTRFRIRRALLQSHPIGQAPGAGRGRPIMRMPVTDVRRVPGCTDVATADGSGGSIVP